MGAIRVTVSLTEDIDGGYRVDVDAYRETFEHGPSDAVLDAAASEAVARAKAARDGVARNEATA